MRVILAGTPSLVLPIFDEIRQSDLEIVAVITNPPKAQGRSGTPILSPVSQWAHSHDLLVFEDGDLSSLEPLLAKVDLVLVVAFGHLIPENLLTLPKCGWVNIHFSHLPEARGAAPVQRLIASGATRIGYTLFRLERGMDTGPTFHRSAAIDITGMTTGEVWQELVSQAAREVLPLLRQIGTGLTPITQESYEGAVPIAPKISSDEARIDWSQAREKVLARIRAFNPAPSAWTTFRGERFIVHRAESDEKTFPHSEPGLMHTEKDELFVATGNGWIRLTEVQPAGKRRMSGNEWARGIVLRDDERFTQ